MDLSDIGFTREELQERVIEKMCDRLLSGTAIDEDGEPYREDSQFKQNALLSLPYPLQGTGGSL